jgi:hypothetical protein
LVALKKLDNACTNKAFKFAKAYGDASVLDLELDIGLSLESLK